MIPQIEKRGAVPQQIAAAARKGNAGELGRSGGRMKGPAAPAACCRLGGTRVAAERGRDDDAFSSRLLLGRREEERAPRLALIAFLPFDRSVGLGCAFFLRWAAAVSSAYGLAYCPTTRPARPSRRFVISFCRVPPSPGANWFDRLTGGGALPSEGKSHR
jgi:hypothetical protein